MNIFIAKDEKISPIKAAINILVLSVLIVVFVYFALAAIGQTLDFSFVQEYSVRLADGFVMTVLLSISSLALSLLIGVGAVLAQKSKVLILRYFAKGYVAFIRGTPLIMQIYLFFYIVFNAIGFTDRFLCGVLILSIFEGAYICEIIRGSLNSMDNTQLEAAKAVGFTKAQTTRYILIPQLVARTLPALTGQFASIIKDSSLLSVIAIIELTQTIGEITAITYNFFGGYIFIGFLYLVLTLPIFFVSKRLERRYSFENRS